MTRTTLQEPIDTSGVDFVADGNIKTLNVSAMAIMKAKMAYLKERKIFPLSSEIRMEIIKGEVLTNEQIQSLTVTSEKSFPTLEVSGAKLIYFLGEVFHTDHVWGKKVEALAGKYKNKLLNDFHREFKSVIYKICSDLSNTFCYKGIIKINIGKLQQAVLMMRENQYDFFPIHVFAAATFQIYYAILRHFDPHIARDTAEFSKVFRFILEAFCRELDFKEQDVLHAIDNVSMDII